MKIYLNGKPIDCDEPRTIEQLIRQHQLPPETTLVEHNGRALRRKDWSNNFLQENDRVEMLQVAAGG
jgi:thiamine biosynthesis protein ThiS